MINEPEEINDDDDDFEHTEYDKPKLMADKAKDFKNKIDDWFSYYQPNNKHYRENIRFVIQGEQWDEDGKGLDETDTRKFTVNMQRKIANSIMGEQEQNTPDPHVSPLDDESKPNNAQLMQNMLRTIMIDPQSHHAEQIAFASQTVGGYGAIRLTNKYEDNFSDYQKVVVEEIMDPTYCFWDPSAEKIHKGDGNYCGYYGTMSRTAFHNKYPKLEYPIGESLPNCKFSWVSEKTIAYFYFYEKKVEDKKLLRLEDGKFLLEEKYNQAAAYTEMPAIEGSRYVPVTKIIAYKFVGDYLIEKKVFPGEELPIIFGGGANTHQLDGREHTRSFFADAKDPQVYANYSMSRQADLLKKFDTNQWAGPAECVEGYEEYWKGGARVAGLKPWKVYIDDKGNAHTPQYIQPSTIPAHFGDQYQRANNDIYNIVGVYETQLGAQGNEDSGKAIDARTGRGNNNTAVLFTANKMMINRMYEVALSMFPHVYSTKRILSIDTPDFGQQQVTINNPINDYEVENDITRGRYNVVARASSSFEAQKRQNLETIIQVANSMGVIQTPLGPMSVAQILGDKIIAEIPINGANEMSARIKGCIPPQIIAAGKGQPVQPPPPQPNPEVELKQKELEVKNKQVDASMFTTQVRAAAEMRKAEDEKVKSQLSTAAAIANAHTKAHGNHTKIFEGILKRHEMAASHYQQQQK
jgi:hypothetical protein